jgi:hypothetical protein
MDQGDWMEYSINPASAGTYTLRLRMATPASGGQLKVKRADGTVLATISVPNTGGWQTWQTTSASLTLAAGPQNIRLESSATVGWNINWFEFSQGGSSVNQPPTVNAGIDQSITLPANTATLNGSAADPDGTIASYAWTKVSGPSEGTITSASSSSTTLTGLVQGVYVFRLSASDDKGASGTDDITITVNAATSSNQPPTVSAGADKSITLPTNSVSLTGSATDADGTIASYAWSKISGGSATITSPSNASTTITGLVQGSYTFRLTATDNKGATASDDVLITVNAQPTPVFSLRIEAESFSSASSVTRQPTQDIDGTEELSSLDNGDWMQYLVNVPYAGTYTVSFRVASTKGGSKFQLLNAAGSLLTTANLPNTGSLQNWQTVSVQATLEQGTQTFKILVNKASGNPTFNWWNISLVNTNTGTGSSTNQEMLVAKDSEEINPASSFLQIFPNPFQDHFVMQIQNSYIGPVQVQLFNLNGALQKQFVFNKTNALSQETFHANELSKGEYVLVMRMSNWEERKKIIKL